MALVLSERGVGTVPEILRMRTDLVMAAWDYATFRTEYDATEAELNKPDPK